jgi:hypothetical protein
MIEFVYMGRSRLSENGRHTTFFLSNMGKEAGGLARIWSHILPDL